MHALILLFVACGDKVPPVAPAAGEAAPRPVPAPPPPPPLPPLPTAAHTCTDGLRAWTRFDGPVRTAANLLFPPTPPDGFRYEVALSADEGGEWLPWTRVQDGWQGGPAWVPTDAALHRDDLLLAPRAEVTLAPPGAAPGSPRVSLAAGAPVRVLEARGAQLLVALDGDATASGWVDAAALGPAWTPCAWQALKSNRTLSVHTQVRTLPSGAPIATIPAGTRVLAVASDAPEGWVRVVFATPRVWVDGYVPAGALREG